MQQRNLFDDRNRDTDYALVKLRCLLGDADPHRLVYFVHAGVPVSKARARWNKKQGRFYTPTKTTTAQEAIAWLFRATVEHPPWEGNIALVAIFYRPNRQRIDGDNLMKLVLDAGTMAGAWKDDCQITAQASFIEIDSARPRTVVAMAPTESSMDRHVAPTYTCEHCRKTFEGNRYRAQRFCSQACAGAHGRTEAICPKCGKVFRRRKTGQRYCSQDCAHSCLLRRQKSALQRPAPTCQTCGGRVSRREYRQCSRCAPKGRKIGSKNKPKGMEPTNG